MDPAQRLGLLEFPRHDQHNIVRLIKFLVKGPQVLDRHALDVAAVANGRLAIIVPVVSGGGDTFAQHAAGRIFSALKFVAHNGHFRFQVLFLDITVDHPVGFQLQGELEVFVCGRQRFEVIDAVAGSAAIELRAVLLQFLGHVRMFRCPFEHHVFEQMGHARLAIPFLA